uniref:(northern house mosquito) hypothetical protein n=1 Tax=Culex pipiens TaxID=7175 RepID=A0A8D8NPY7_CULPI
MVRTILATWNGFRAQSGIRSFRSRRPTSFSRVATLLASSSFLAASVGAFCRIVSFRMSFCHRSSMLSNRGGAPLAASNTFLASSSVQSSTPSIRLRTWFSNHSSVRASLKLGSEPFSRTFSNVCSSAMFGTRIIHGLTFCSGEFFSICNRSTIDELAYAKMDKCLTTSSGSR